MVNYSMIQQEISILRSSSYQDQVSIFRHWKITIDVNQDWIWLMSTNTASGS